VLRVRPGAVDIERFEMLADAARRAGEIGEVESAASAYRQALALWRGPALADVAYEAFAQRESARLEELRLGWIQGRIEADLELGRHAELVPELQALVREHPLNEELRASLMLALYRTGRQADALDEYRDARRVLVDELGLEPGPQLHDLQRLVLDQDRSLDPPDGREWARRGSLLDSTIVAVLLATGILIVVPIVRGGR
jgi:DNA-binding SARP family transcriptional activator